MVVSRIRMPLFAYFAVVAPALLGILLAAEAMMGPPGPMPLSSESPVLVKRQSAQTDTVQILTVREPVAVPSSALAANAEAPRQQAAASPAAAGRPVAQAEEPRKRVAAAPKRKSQTSVARERDRRDLYAFEPRQRSFFNVW